MSKTSLFGNTTAKSKHLVEFKAGKMTIDDKNWVHADKRKGLAYVHQGNDGLIHFCWKDRTSGIVEDDLIIFPDDTEFKRIRQCKTGRVYLLKFKDSKKFFLWLQEPKIDKDDEICKKVNDSFNTPLHSKKVRNNDIHELFANATGTDYQDLMSLLGIEASGRDTGAESEVSSRISSAANPNKPPVETKPESTLTPAVAESSTSLSSAKFKINDLRAILSNIQTSPNENQSGVQIDLTDVVNSESVLPLLQDTQNVSRVQQLLPPNEHVELLQHIKDNIQSPQMHAAVKTFGAALQSGQLAPVVSQFGLGEDVNVAAQTGNIKQFAQTLEANVLCPTKQKDNSSTIDNNVKESRKPADESVQGDEAMDQD